MTSTSDMTARLICGFLCVIVATQLIYVALSNSGADINRPLIWSTEALAFLAISVLALVSLVRAGHAAQGWAALAWAAIAVSGILNTVQVGMGLAMFGPVAEAGEAMEPVYRAIVAGAFFLYFAGKLLFGFAAIAVGADLLRATGLAKGFAIVTIVAGAVALGVNLAAMAIGMSMVFPAGATGTAATLLLAIGLTMRARLPLRHAEPSAC